MNNRRVYKIIFFVLLIFFSLLKYSICKAQYQDIIINELMWSGSETSTSDEWIELRNLSSQEIDISGWKIKKVNDDEMVVITSGKIPANGYFLIANSSHDHNYAGGESILNIVPDYIDSGVSLSNSNLQIKLVDLNDITIDIAGDGNKPLAGNNNKKYSMERNDIVTDGTIASSWHTATTSVNLDLNSLSKATPKAPNSPQLFQKITNYPENLDKYITIDDCLEAKGVVVKIIDGDTIDIDLNGDITRVRFLGIDAPESSKSSDFKINEPYYQESKDYIENLLNNKQVTIIVSSNPNSQFDKYQRLLALILIDDRNANILSIREGLSRSYYLDNPVLKKDSWFDDEKYAQMNHLNIWKNYGIKSDVYINEIMPNPSGDDSQNEWIELYNASDQVVDLSNWFIDDSEYGSNPYLIPTNTKIMPKGYYVISIIDSKIILNNDGDQVRLFTPDLNIVDEISYSESAKEEISYMRSETGNFLWTKTPTRGGANIYTDPEKPDYQEIDNINKLHEQSPGDFVQVEGYVNVEPHQVADQYFYIEDHTGGVQIYNYDKKFPDLQIGQKITVLGEMSDASILRIKIKNINDIFILDEIIIFTPPKLFPHEVEKTHIGKIIKVEGEISKLSGQTFYIKDQHQELAIQIRGPTNFKRPELKRGDVIEVTGILYQSSQGNITLLPRFIDDIYIVEKIQTKSSQENPVIVDKIKNLKNFQEDDYILVKGIVNCLPGMLGERYFYIQDETGGVEIYSHNKFFPDLNIGDYIEVVGKLSASKNRIKTYSENSFQIIHKNHPINPVIINSDTNIVENFGQLVMVRGIVIAKKNNKITISLDGNKFIIYFKNATKLKPSMLKVGDNVEILGIVDNYQNEYRINPRFIEDISYQRSIKIKKSQVKGTTSTTIKSFAKNNFLPKMEKYLANGPQKKYNLETLINIVKTLLVVLQFLLFITIIDWLWIKKYT